MAESTTVTTSLPNLLQGQGNFSVFSERFELLFSNESLIKMHTHVLALILLYLFVHVFVVLGDTRDNTSDDDDDNDDDNSERISLCLTNRSKLMNFIAVGLRQSSVVSQDSTNESSDDDDDSAAAILPPSSSISPSREDLELELEKQCPQSTLSERRRFLVACKYSIPRASDQLNHYLEWHHQYHDIQSTGNFYIRPTKDRDYDIWVESCLVAMTGNEEKVTNIVLPRVIRSYSHPMSSNHSIIQQTQQDHLPTTTRITTQHRDDHHHHQVTDQDGHRIFHIIPGMMDDKLASLSTYALAVALYLDRQVDRHSMDTVTFCMDVRGGRGWPNVHALKLVPFMKNSLKFLLPLFPERLHKCVVYPLPSAFFFLWRMISKCMDAETAAKICVVSGPCTIEAPPPTEKLMAHLGEQPVLLLEPTRVSKFKS
jgi:hypothetical protein